MSPTAHVPLLAVQPTGKPSPAPARTGVVATVCVLPAVVTVNPSRLAAAPQARTPRRPAVVTGSVSVTSISGSLPLPIQARMRGPSAVIFRGNGSFARGWNGTRTNVTGFFSWRTSVTT